MILCIGPIIPFLFRYYNMLHELNLLCYRGWIIDENYQFMLLLFFVCVCFFVFFFGCGGGGLLTRDHFRFSPGLPAIHNVI